MLLVCVIKFLAEITTVFLYYNDVDNDLIVIIDIAVCWCICIVSGLIPIIESFREETTTTNFVTSQVVSNFDLTLINEKAFTKFHLFLAEEAADGANLLDFWTVSNVFKYKKKEATSSILASEIYDKFLKETAQAFINFDPILVQRYLETYSCIHNDKYNDAMEEMKEIAYNQLKNYYFPRYVSSKRFLEFKRELEKEEVIYSRLVASEMLSTSDFSI